MSAWDAMSYEGKDTILRVVRKEASRLFALAEQPGAWEAPTACESWAVRDVVGHLVDTTEGYFAAFEKARSGADATAHGLAVMHERAGEAATEFRALSQPELMARARADFDRMMGILEPLTAEEWSGLIVPHSYMGPVPAFIYAAGQLMDYTVHSWDIRQGTGRAHGLPPKRPTCWCRSCSSSGSQPSARIPTRPPSASASPSPAATRAATGSTWPTRACPTSRGMSATCRR